ncbi:MAG: hypothetical protein P8180_01745 [Gammaproteobacteria bacterium]|jgi:hypothetical protein
MTTSARRATVLKEGPGKPAATNGIDRRRRVKKRREGTGYRNAVQEDGDLWPEGAELPI